jgi:hypothetical protein
MFPSFGPLEQGCNGPTADFFDKLNRIQYMWMSHSDGLYSPPDSSESSLLDLFGSSMLASISIALAVDGVAQACMDNDSRETDTASVHINSDGTVTSVCLGPDGMND